MNNINLSVILPCYNVEKYINDCLDSILKQTCKPREIICIDDGSTDKTATILSNYAEKFKNIKIILQSNQGVSYARNRGLDQAIGEYILFVDSDDILHKDFFLNFKLILDKNPYLDIFYFDYKSFKNREEINDYNEPLSPLNKHFENGINLLNFLLEKCNYSGVVWRYIFKKDLILIKFSEKMHEDHLISLSIFKQSKSLCHYTSQVIYFHRVHNLSLSNRAIDIANTTILKKVLTDCFYLINQLPLSNTAKQNYILPMCATYLEYLLNSTQPFSPKDREEIIKELGRVKLLIRIHIWKKKAIFRNCCFILKYSKHFNCSWKIKVALLKCAITKQHSLVNTKTGFSNYNFMNY